MADARLDQAERVLSVSGLHEEYGPLFDAVRERFGSTARRPFLIGIGGSVAVGKTTVAATLAALLRAPGPTTLDVEVVSTDGFLFPNDELDARGLSMRKGTPMSHDTPRLVAFLDELRNADGAVRAPLYSHDTYDVVVGEHHDVEPADVVILEGIHVLQAHPGGEQTVSSHLDLTIYVDAQEHDIERWFVDRFLQQRVEAVWRRQSFFSQFVDLDDPTAESIARWTWTEINRPTLVDHVLPRREDADLVIEKASDHSIRVLRRPQR